MQLVGVALDRSGAVVVDLQLAVAQQRRRLGGGVAGDLGEVAAAVRAEPAGVGAGEQQQVGDQAAHPPRGAQGRVDHRAVVVLAGSASEACSSSRLARMLVSGVRSSCEASATNSRCFFIAASRSARAASSERSICSRVRASSPTSSSAFGLRHVARGVAGVGDLARGRGQRGDRPHRPAGDRDAGEAGEQGAAEDAGGDEEPEPVDGRVDVGDAAPVLDEAGRELPFAARRRRSRRACRRRSRGRGVGGPERGGAGAVFEQVAVDVVDARRGVVGADEVVELGTAWMSVPSGV